MSDCRELNVSVVEYIPCASGVVICEVQSLEQKMTEKFTSDVSEKEEGGGKKVVEKVNLQQHFCQHWRALTL